MDFKTYFAYRNISKIRDGSSLSFAISPSGTLNDVLSLCRITQDSERVAQTYREVEPTLPENKGNGFLVSRVGSDHETDLIALELLFPLEEKALLFLGAGLGPEIGRYLCKERKSFVCFILGRNTISTYLIEDNECSEMGTEIFQQDEKRKKIQEKISKMKIFKKFKESGFKEKSVLVGTMEDSRWLENYLPFYAKLPTSKKIADMNERTWEEFLTIPETSDLQLSKEFAILGQLVEARAQGSAEVGLNSVITALENISNLKMVIVWEDIELDRCVFQNNVQENQVEFLRSGQPHEFHHLILIEQTHLIEWLNSKLRDGACELVIVSSATSRGNEFVSYGGIAVIKKGYKPKMDKQIVQKKRADQLKKELEDNRKAKADKERAIKQFAGKRGFKKELAK